MSHLHNALFARRKRIELLNRSNSDNVGKVAYAGNYEIIRYKNGYAVQNRSSEHMSMRVKVGSESNHHRLSPRSVILVTEEEIIPLGTGIWPNK